MKTKLCGSCRKEKEASEYYTDKRGILGLNSRCKECFRKMAGFRGHKAKKGTGKTYADYIRDDIAKGNLTEKEGKEEIRTNRAAKLSGSGGVFHGKITK